MIYQVPVQIDTPFWSQETTLDGRSYTLEFSWNEREESWYLSIFTDPDTAICSGIRMVMEWPLGFSSSNDLMPPGSLVFADPSGSVTVPTFESMGRSCFLYYFDESEISE